MLRSAILAAARNRTIERVVSGAPVSRDVVSRFVGGPDTASAVAATRALVADGLTVTLDHLGEDTVQRDHADAVLAAYRAVLRALHEAGLTDLRAPLTSQVEVSVKLSALGQLLEPDGEKTARDHAASICAAARDVGATVTLDMEDHTLTDSTLSILRDLRADFPSTGAVLQAYLFRTEADCRDLAAPGSRVRLCKGAYDEPADVAFRSREEVDESYRRCADVLLDGGGYPMFATHDPDLLSHVQAGAARRGLPDRAFELQMLYGIRPEEQKRLALLGRTVRVYVPYGDQWYGYLMRRLAERPANVGFFLRALVSKS